MKVQVSDRPPIRMLLGDLLVNNQVISPCQLEEAITLRSGESKPLGEILIERGIVPEQKVKIALQEQFWRKNGYWVIH